MGPMGPAGMSIVGPAGPKGDTGAQGPPGTDGVVDPGKVYIVYDTVPVRSGQASGVETAVVYCTPGDMALSGGCSLTYPNNGGELRNNTPIYDRVSNNAPTGWGCTALMTAPNSLSATAVCLAQ